METNRKSYENKGKLIIKLAKAIGDKIKLEEKSEKDKIIESLRSAEKEWKEQEEYFQYVTEPDLVDYAIHQMEASKLKYIYLLKKAKGIKK